MRFSARVTVAVIGAVVAVGAPAASAAASPFHLALKGPRTSVVGRPVIFRAVGSNPPYAQYPYPTWLSVSLLRSRVISRCPRDGNEAAQLAASTGGALLAVALREDANAAGRFTIRIGFTPIIRARFLLCAYSSNENGSVFAIGSNRLTVKRGVRR